MATRTRKCVFVVMLTLQAAMFVLYLATIDLLPLYFKGRNVRSTTHEGVDSTNKSQETVSESDSVPIDVKQIMRNFTETTDKTPESMNFTETSDKKPESMNFTETSDKKPESKDSEPLSGSQQWARDGNGSFQPIDDQEAWLYSAHFDHVAAENGTPEVRVFGVAREDLLIKVYCRFTRGHKQVTSVGQLEEMPDSHNKQFRPCYAKCRLWNHFRPSHVSVSFLSQGRPTNVLEVLYPGTQVINLTVCYSVLHSGYNHGKQLIFSIEINRLLGAGHFVIYNNNVSAEVELILRQYQKEGLVTILPWAIPNRDTWYFGQMTALNDCFFRSRIRSELVVVIDTDELMVPRKHWTWTEMINNVTMDDMVDSICTNGTRPAPTDTASIASFVIVSSFFTSNLSTNFNLTSSYGILTEEERKLIDQFKMNWFLEVWRSKVFEAKYRSKYIARPTLVDVCGIHYVHKFVKDSGCHTINQDLAMMHHYRESKDLKAFESLVINNKTINPKLGATQDTTLLRFKEKLIPRVVMRHKILNYTLN